MIAERLDRSLLLKLLAGWVALVILPGVLVLGQRLTLAYFVWGLGFIGQLLVFLKVAKLARVTEVWPWLVASILPWVVNFEIPGHPWRIALFAVLAIAMAYYLHRRAVIADRITHEGVGGLGTVVEVVESRLLGSISSGGPARRTVKLTVTRPDVSEPYEATLREVYSPNTLPEPGDVVHIRIDPQDRQRLIAVPGPPD